MLQVYVLKLLMVAATYERSMIQVVMELKTSEHCSQHSMLAYLVSAKVKLLEA